MNPRPYILMLVPHDPDDDPRIGWVKSLCADVGRTEIIGVTQSTEKQARDFNGLTYIERVNLHESASGWTKATAAALSLLYVAGPTKRYVSRDGRHPRAVVSRKVPGIRSLLSSGDHYLGSLLRFVSAWGSYSVLISALYRRARAASVMPRLVICHDLYALVAAVRLKRFFDCPVIYDSHEFWPEAELIGQPWEARLLSRLEGWLVRKVDIVITVSPQLARHVQTLYSLPRVLSVPNAAPFDSNVVPSCDRLPSWPVRFLFQGRIAPSRGVERLMESWCSLEDGRAILYLRSLESRYLQQLQERFGNAIAAGRIVILPPTSENRLVEAATFADVGIIPYIGPNLNHVYACPNKLSEYMQAGLAILGNRLEFVAELTGRYGCGLTYDAIDPASLAAAVKVMIGDLDQLQRMKRNSYNAAKTDFNWRSQSAPYRAAIRELMGVDRAT